MAIRSPQVAKDILQSMKTGPKKLMMNIGKSENEKEKGSDDKENHGGLVQKDAERNHMGIAQWPSALSAKAFCQRASSQQQLHLAHNDSCTIVKFYDHFDEERNRGVWKPFSA